MNDRPYRWEHDAACKGMPAELWFPEGQGQAGNRAKKICDTCPVSETCFTEAMQRGEQCGIWGGINFSRGTRAYRKARAAA